MSAPPSNGGEPPRARASLFRRARKPAPIESDPPQQKKPKKPRRSLLSSLSAFLTFVLVGALLAVGAIAWLMMEGRKAGPLTADKIVNIVREDDGGSIADQLERAGVIDSSTWFTLLTLLDGNRSTHEARRVRVPGRRQHERGREPAGDAQGCAAQDHPSRGPDQRPDRAAAARRRRARRRHQGDPARGLADARHLLFRARRHAPVDPDARWRRRRPGSSTRSGRAARPTCRSDRRARWSRSPRSSRRRPARPKSARTSPSVFVNRLQKHMRLESDPTIVYGLVFGKGTLGRPISRADLNQATPYNTYVIDGLPPGPISNPGKAALEAVANPAHTRDLYFVADGTGGHVFAEFVRPAPEERRPLAPDREGRQGPSRARRDPDGALRHSRRARARRPVRVRRARRDRAGRPRPAPSEPGDRRAPRQDRRRPQGDGRRRCRRSPAARRAARRSRISARS